MSRWEIEAYLYLHDEEREGLKESLPKWRHLLNMAICDFAQDGSQDIFIVHPYVEEYFQHFCEHEWVDSWGPGGLGKSAGWAMVAYQDWKADPMNTTSVLVSNEIQMIMQRVWKFVEAYFHADRNPLKCGEIYSNPLRLELRPKKDGPATKSRSGIYCVAIPEWETVDGVMRQLGRHNRRTRMFIDEKQSVGAAAVAACANLDDCWGGGFSAYELGQSQKPIGFAGLG